MHVHVNSAEVHNAVFQEWEQGKDIANITLGDKTNDAALEFRTYLRETKFTLVLSNPLVEIVSISFFFTMPILFTFILFTKHLHNRIAIISLKEVAWAQINSLTSSRAIEEPISIQDSTL